ncbi:hypothetical protein [Nocardioides convexus]|uniref:hypothetical protein n=1 Tax=Nocardioides convexus TaxID=2712224 RepID=UPI003101291E
MRASSTEAMSARRSTRSQSSRASSAVTNTPAPCRLASTPRPASLADRLAHGRAADAEPAAPGWSRRAGAGPACHSPARIRSRSRPAACSASGSRRTWGMGTCLLV